MFFIFFISPSIVVKPLPVTKLSFDTRTTKTRANDMNGARLASSPTVVFPWPPMAHILSAIVAVSMTLSQSSPLPRFSIECRRFRSRIKKLKNDVVKTQESTEEANRCLLEKKCRRKKIMIELWSVY